MNNREAFEAWAEKELLPLDRRDSEHYRYNLTNRAWAGWKAGLASQPAELSSNPLQLPAQKQQDHIPDGGEMVQSQAQQESKQGCKECDGQTYIHSPTGEYLGECPFCTKEEEPYAYDVPTDDGTELAYAIYFTKYNNPLPEGAIPLYLQSQAQQTESKWVSVEDRLPPQSTDVLVYPMLSAYSHVAWHDGGCWRVTEYEKGLGEVHTALNDGLVTHWMPLPPAPEGE